MSPLSGISLVRLALAGLALLFLLDGLVRFARGEHGQTLFKLLSRLVLWGAVLLFALFPQTSHVISQRLGLGENLNTLIFGGFVAVFFVLFKLLNAVERLERSISEIVRREALEKLEEPPAPAPEGTAASGRRERPRPRP